MEYYILLTVCSVVAIGLMIVIFSTVIIKETHGLSSKISDIRDFIYGEGASAGWFDRVESRLGSSENHLTEADNAIKDFKNRLDQQSKSGTQHVLDFTEYKEQIHERLEQLEDHLNFVDSTVDDLFDLDYDETTGEAKSAVLGNLFKNDKDVSNLLLNLLNVTVDNNGVYHSGIVDIIESMQEYQKGLDSTLKQVHTEISLLKAKVFPPPTPEEIAEIQKRVLEIGDKVINKVQPKKVVRRKK